MSIISNTSVIRVSANIATTLFAVVIILQLLLATLMSDSYFYYDEFGLWYKKEKEVHY